MNWLTPMINVTAPLKQKQWDNTGQVLSGRLHKNGAAALIPGALGLKFG
jgi:hypothetical protein